MADETDEDHEVKVDDSSVGTVGQILKTITSSVACKYFDVKSNSSGVDKLEKPVCKLCKKEFPAKGSNTSNLFKHLEISHPEA